MATPAQTAAFVRAVRSFAEKTPAWAEALRYQTTPDERRDLTLISFRAYGTRAEHVAVFAALGLDTMEQEVPEQLIVLPTANQLLAIKRQTGYLTDEEKAALDALT